MKQGEVEVVVEVVQEVDNSTLLSQKKRLGSKVRKGEWNKVVEIYKECREVRLTKITQSGGTALHMAVYEGKEDIVRQLVDLMEMSDLKELADDTGNTPLHLAAKMGNNTMCRCIASKKSGLISDRNKEGETPMFLAALHGKEDTFLILCFFFCFEENIYSWDDPKIYLHGRRTKDGTTILHRAIDGEYFELAFQIINRFPDFLDCFDERGCTPLHILATKHSAFRSSSHLTWLQQLIYRCIPVVQSSMIKDTRDVVDDANRSNRLCWMKFLFPNDLVEMKKKHMWANYIKGILLKQASNYDNLSTGSTPEQGYESILQNEIPNLEHKQTQSIDEARNKRKTETTILIAAKNGIGEIVKDILNKYPVAIHDVNSEGKNVMHLAVENRQSHIYELLLKNSRFITEDLFNSVDNKGNNALHLVAMFDPYQFWIVPNAVLQMQWEIKWYEYIKKSMPRHLLSHQNEKGKTPNEIFLKTHSKLLKNDKEWLTKTSEQCSIVATLIATVAFATSTNVPSEFIATVAFATSTNVPSEFTGNKGKPFLKEMGAFKLFAIPSIVALCTSLTAVAIFLSILTSQYQATEFRLKLPLKLVFGLTALFAAVISMLISFSSGHFFVIKDIVRHATLVEFIGAFLLPVTCFVLMLFPLYRNVWLAIVQKIPQRGYKVTV